MLAYVGAHELEALEADSAEIVGRQQVLRTLLACQVQAAVVLDRQTSRDVEQVGRADMSAGEVEHRPIGQRRVEPQVHRPHDAHVDLRRRPGVLVNQQGRFSRLRDPCPVVQELEVLQQLVSRDQVRMRSHVEHADRSEHVRGVSHGERDR
ncbi:hypothetical protein ACFP8W_01380 [Nocardioides hankookensis]